MKKTLLIIGANLAAVLLMAAQPGSLPTTAYMPGAAVVPRSFVYDGGAGSVPQVVVRPLLAPSYFEINGGILPAISGIDGGNPIGIELEERGEITSATSPAFSLLNHLFTAPPNCICTIQSGASSINTCVAQQDAGFAPQYQNDAGPVTTVVIGTLAADGGTWNYDCIGY